MNETHTSTVRLFAEIAFAAGFGAATLAFVGALSLMKFYDVGCAW